MQLSDWDKCTYSDFRYTGVITKRPTKMQLLQLVDIFEAATDDDIYSIELLMKTLKTDLVLIKSEVKKGYWKRAIGAYLMGGKNGYYAFKNQYDQWVGFLKMSDKEMTSSYYEEIHSLRPSLKQSE